MKIWAQSPISVRKGTPRQAFEKKKTRPQLGDYGTCRVGQADCRGYSGETSLTTLRRGKIGV